MSGDTRRILAEIKKGSRRTFWAFLANLGLWAFAVLNSTMPVDPFGKIEKIILLVLTGVVAVLSIIQYARYWPSRK